MSNGFRPRAASAPVTSIGLRELNKYKDKRICKEDLEIFLEKYKKESKILNFLRGLPPEMKIIEIIAGKTKSFLTQRTPISDEDKEVLSNMIAMNQEHRSTKASQEVRLRDVIIDRMIQFFGLEKELELQYLSFDDYL